MVHEFIVKRIVKGETNSNKTVIKNQNDYINF